jgi:GT2 family glycosyltransferase
MVPRELDCSVVVLARDREDLTHRCFEALSVATRDLRSEVLFVDNGSTDGTPRRVREWESWFPRFVYLRQEENLSFAVGNNLAARQAAGSLLLFLNNDVFVEPDSVRRLVDEVSSDEDVGAAGARLVFPGGAKIQHAGVAQMLWGYPLNYGAGAATGDIRLASPRDAFAVTGALACVRRSAFLSVGGFDSTFDWGYEDVDLCLALRAAGLRVRYVPEAVATHCESATLAPVRQTSRDEANHRRYRTKWGARLEPLETAYAAGLARTGIRRVLVFGTGRAARGVEPPLRQAAIEIAGYTSSDTTSVSRDAAGRLMLPLEEVGHVGVDAVLVATQAYFEVEAMLRSRVTGVPILHPVVA